MSSAEPTMNIPVPPVDPRRLLVRRALGPDARSREDFLWPFFGPVEMFQPETFNDNPQDCGPGLYGNSCAPSVAERQNYVWKGNFWRLWLAESDPVICPDGKAKAPRGFVLAAGSCYHIAREVVRYGGELPTTLRKELRQRTSPFLAFTHTPEEYQAALLLAEQKDLEQEGQERVRVGLARLGRAVATWGALGSGYPLSAGDPPPQYDRLKRWADSKALLPDVDSQFILKLLEVSTLDAVNLKRAFDLSYVTTDKAAARPQVTPDSVYAIRDVEEWVVTRVPYEEFLVAKEFGLRAADWVGRDPTLPLASSILLLVTCAAAARLATSRGVWVAISDLQVLAGENVRQVMERWLSGDGYKVTAVSIHGRPPTRATSTRQPNSIAVYYGISHRNEITKAPAAWINPAHLAKYRKATTSDVVDLGQVNWRELADRHAIRRSKIKTREDRRLGRAEAILMEGVEQIYHASGGGKPNWVDVTVTLKDGRTATQSVPHKQWVKYTISDHVTLIVRLRTNALMQHPRRTQG